VLQTKPALQLRSISQGWPLSPVEHFRRLHRPLKQSKLKSQNDPTARGPHQFLLGKQTMLPVASVPQSVSRTQNSPRFRNAWQVRPLQARPVAQSVSVVHAQPVGLAERATQSLHLPTLLPDATLQTSRRVSSSKPVHCSFKVHPHPKSPPLSPATQMASRSMPTSAGSAPHPTSQAPKQTAQHHRDASIAFLFSMIASFRTPEDF
jgi:hypothetical protein